MRVFKEPSDSNREILQAPTIRVRLAEILPLIALAQKKNYVWLQDFLDDEVGVTPDLYEVLRSFATTARPAC
ncbi:MAG: hypothetical protein EXR99_14865 [Gemmataceae bacterium]|nr:hypothetical protein [Gemmataceae bacterium]